MNAKHPRALGACAAAAIAFWSCFFVYSLHGAMGFTSVKLPFEGEVRTQTWIPQGWAFFTREPQEERLYVYQRDASGVFGPAWMTPHAMAKNAFGMDRASRAQGVEMGQFLEGRRDDEWTACSVPLAECIAQAPTLRTVKNAMPARTLCGSIAIVKQKLLPWAWNRFEATATMPESVVKLEVQC